MFSGHATYSRRLLTIDVLHVIVECGWGWNVFMEIDLTDEEFEDYEGISDG